MRAITRGRVFVVAASIVASVAIGCGSSGSSSSSSAGASIAASTSSSTPASSVAVAAPRVPIVLVLAPQDGVQLPPLKPVQLVGEAKDPSGAPIAASALVWRSSIDGVIGNGARVVWNAPSPGIHLITLEATPPSGTSGRASVRAFVMGAAGTGSKDLAAYLQSIAPKILGNPVQFPPTFDAQLNACQSDVNAASGSGGLTAGVSRSGVLTTLKWPSPSYDDQMDWLSSPGRLPGYGQLESQGAFAGVALDVGGRTVVSFFREPGWTSAQRYLDDDGAVVVTEHDNVALGLRAREILFVNPDRDVLVQTIAVERLAGGPLRARLIWYENLSPCAWRIPWLPLADSLFDVLNDFACGWHSREQALVHFRPAGFPDYKPLYAFATSSASQDPARVDAWLDAAPSAFGRGAFAAIGADRAPADFQVGEDASGNGPATGGASADAYADAQDGKLSGSLFAAARANAALGFDLDLRSGQDARTIFVAFGPDLDGPDGARTTLRWARAQTPDAHLARARSWWRSKLAPAKLPNTTDTQVIAAAKRSLVTAITAQDRASGAIVASICTQLPYGEDWPRDGSFINHMLDLAGYRDLVEKHCDFYARVQRQGLLLPGSFEMNYYADGTPGGPIPWEIDEAALGCWTMAAHRTFEPDPAHRAAYLARVYPAIRRGAELLRTWRDAASGLPLPANEDDHPALTQGLQGSISIVVALDEAIAAGKEIGESASVVASWQQRRDELAQIVTTRFWDSSRGVFDAGANGGAETWCLWPATVLAPGDPRAASQADALQRALDDVLVAKRSQRSGYDAKSTLAIAARFANDPARRPRVERSLKALIGEVATPDTGHFGEFYKLVPSGGATRWEPVNDAPHVWEHALVYLTSMELYR